MAIKLGKWERGSVATNVYQREDGLKIHGNGLIKEAGKPIVEVFDYPTMNYYKKLVGGRPTRAMMHYANVLYPIKEKQNDK